MASFGSVADALCRAASGTQPSGNRSDVAIYG